MPRSKLREPSTVMMELVEKLRREVAARLGPDSTFEERRVASAALMQKVLAKVLDEEEEEDHAETHRRRR